MKESEIFINQIGYKPADNKTVFVSAAVKGEKKEFTVCEKSGGAKVFTGELLAAPEDVESGGGYFTGDFSAVKAEGEYYIQVNGQQSFSFKISEKVYDEVVLSTLKYFTDSRCGQGVCHTGIAEVYGTGEKKNVQGGWHDAGDYGRYTVAGTKAVMDLLMAYKKCPEKFAGFGSAGKGGFDLLGEARFELEWLLQMQREDGAVYHKISCYNFCAFIMPEEEKDPLVLAPVSTAATADFAGCLAYASGFYKDSDAVFAKKLLQAALKAQNYLFSHDDELYINPPEITTGGYGDRDVRDERYFALCSLFAVTKEQNYLTQALKLREEKSNEKPDPEHPWNSGWHEVFGWPFVSGYGTEILLEKANLLPAELLEEIKKGVINQAEKYVEASRASAFKYCSKFVFWGSNGAICDLAHLLLLAYDLTGREEFRSAAKAQLDYILGCNPLNYCYITGAGTKSPKKPHHRPSGACKKVYPGMLAGGPCAGLYDAYAKEHLTGRPPLKCYIDAQPSYSTNEVAIYWNSSFVYAFARVR